MANLKSKWLHRHLSVLSKAISFPEVRLFTEFLLVFQHIKYKYENIEGCAQSATRTRDLKANLAEEPALITVVALYQNASPKSLSNLEV